jgi:UDP-GlcNAc:undecaprenyl-phosphate/decaprenyl-phosphate GlcNAc-1-phosphate transferase
MFNIPLYIGSFVVSVLLSLVLTWFVRRAALASGWVSSPSAHHIHKEAIPRLGGVAIYSSFLFVVAGILIVSSVLDIDIGLSPWTLAYVLLPGTVMFGLGLYDDIRPVSSYTKLVIQTFAATFLFWAGLRILNLPVVFNFHSAGLWSWPLTVLWVLWITNAFNLIDGVDGLAAGSALFSTITVFIVSLINQNILISLFTLVLVGSILGFLRFNFNPATIFLGDCGSLFIGFMLSAFALIGAQQKTPTGIAVAIPVVAFGLPIVEAGISIVRRFLSAQPLMTADREHIHHKLLERGLSQKQVVIVLYAVSAIFGLLSLFLLYPGTRTTGIVLFVLGVGICVGIRQLGYHEFHEVGRVASRTIEQRNIIKNNIAIRRAAEKLGKTDTFAEICAVLKEGFSKNDFDGFQLTLGHPHVLQCENPYTWTKIPQVAGEPNWSARWSLELQLTTEDNEVLGRFRLWRSTSSRPLLIDIGLLTGDFQTSLTDAIEHVRNYDGARQSESARSIRSATRAASGT